MSDEIRTHSWWMGLTAEKILGVVFVLAAALKAWDLEAFAVQIRYYHVLRDPLALSLAAVGSVAWETLLGVAMIVGLRLRGWTFAAVMATLAVFTGLVLYAWYFHDLEDCGCFGSLAPMGPASTTAKNVVLFALTTLAWFGLRSGHLHIEGTLWQHPYLKAAIVAVSCVLVLLAGIFHAPFEPNTVNGNGEGGGDKPFLAFEAEYEGRTFDTSQGEYFIAFLSDTCEECQAESPMLSDYLYIPEMPTVIAFLLVENEETLEAFRNLAEFPTIEMPPMEWFRYIDEAPPRFYLARDGQEIAHWDEHLPPPEAILDALKEQPPQAE